MAIGPAAGLANGATIALSIVLAFVFGYGLTSMPLLRAGCRRGAVAGVALASDTLSITTMEIVDNPMVARDPGRDRRRLGAAPLLGSLAFRSPSRGAHRPREPLAARRGKGHAAVHETGITAAHR